MSHDPFSQISDVFKKTLHTLRNKSFTHVELNIDNGRNHLFKNRSCSLSVTFYPEAIEIMEEPKAPSLLDKITGLFTKEAKQDTTPLPQTIKMNCMNAESKDTYIFSLYKTIRGDRENIIMETVDIKEDNGKLPFSYILQELERELGIEQGTLNEDVLNTPQSSATLSPKHF